MRPALLVLPACALAVAVYAGVWNQGFVWDDHYSIERGQLIRDPANIGRLFTTDAWANTYPDRSRAYSAANIYRPLQTLSFMASWHLHGDDPTGYHVENVLLHALCVLLVFSTWRRLSGSAGQAAWAAAFFAVLPVNSEGVAWISGRSDPLITAALLGAVLCHVRGRAAGGWAAAAWTAATAGLYGAALLVKESAIVLPGLLLAWEWLLAEDGAPWRTRLARIAWLVLPLAGYLALRQLALGQAQVGVSSLAGSRLLLDTVPITATYLSWLLVPHTLTVARSWSPPGLLTEVAVGAAAVVLMGAVLAHRRRSPGPAPRSFGLAWFVAAISPAVLLTLLSGGMAERYVYLPGVGAAFWMGREAHGFQQWMTRTGRGAKGRALLGLIVLLLWVRTALRVEDWKDDFTLYLAAVEEEPDNPEALYRLGTHLAEWGEVQAAGKLLAQANELQPGNTQVANNLAVVYRRRGDLDRARDVLLRALPYGAGDARLHYNLGLVELDLGRIPLAMTRFERALEIDPEYGLARAMLEQVRSARRPEASGEVRRAEGALER